MLTKVRIVLKGSENRECGVAVLSEKKELTINGSAVKAIVRNVNLNNKK